ncbi:family 43 glycosylhydrolase [Anaerocolumna sedimenticola]|uniref:Family 43 glycosylhydrolase n=1 Tax=Anaerocolumna sedimenticola TaxID=2696063 RepID=A0A6P1TMG5_9FIRM|nr:family 43 glycosylhydrolase [Anaerocolumna sedimenticola]QHQ61663.1 family 43 glycosylhydrolase [Anaerocolumna sedimenticola]
MNKDDYRKTEFNNPFIEQRADPYIYKHRDGYYFTASVPEYDRIVLRRSATLEGLRTAEEKVLWKKHDIGIMSIHVWAPEIHYINGVWYIYFAAGDKEDIWAIRPYVLECKEEDPMEGCWTEAGPLQGADDFTFKDFSLDVTVFENRNKWYCIWAEKVSVGKKISHLYIAEMETPIKLKTQQKLLSSPDYEWERVDFWVNEAPSVVRHDGKLYVTYSASATGECYCIGMLSIPDEQDLLDPRTWTKKRYPMLKTDYDKGLFGPGHNCFIRSEDNKTDIMVYHARQYNEITGDSLYDHNRHTYCMKLVWDNQGEPIFRYENNLYQ